MTIRVALLAYACDPERGTEPGVGWQWARHLAAAGFQVELVTRHDPSTTARLRTAIDLGGLQSNLRLHSVPAPVLRTSEERLVPSPLRTAWSTSRRYLGWLAAAESYLDAGPAVDVVHHVTYGSLSCGSVLLRRRPALVFGPVSGAQRAPRGLRAMLGSDRWQESVRDAFAAAAARRSGRAHRTVTTADVLLATNSVTSEAARARGAARVELMLADGLTEDYLVTAPPQRDLTDPVVLWVGGFRAIKLPTLAVAAFRRLRDVIPGARLRMIGDGPLRPQVERASVDLGVADAVDLTGQIPWAQTKDAYDSASALLFTSARDAFGAQSLEAWGRGLPSVGFAQHGLADFAPAGGTVLVPPGPPTVAARRLGDALVEVLADPGRHHRMELSALAVARSHTWQAKVSRVGELYDQALSARSGRAFR